MGARSVRRSARVRSRPAVECKTLLATDGAQLVMYRIPPRYRGAMHSHPAAQLGVILEGTGEHRMLLTVQRGGRARQELTEIGLRPGDYFFVPSGVPHDFSVADESPVVCVEMTLGAGSPALAAELLPRRSRGVRRVR